MKVLITERAEKEIQEAHDWWADNRSTNQAARWYRGIRTAIDSLRNSPDRCPLVSEHNALGIELRQLAYGIGRRPTHRIVFLLRPDTVVVVTVRHLAQQDIAFDDIAS